MVNSLTTEVNCRYVDRILNFFRALTSRFADFTNSWVAPIPAL